MFYPAPGGVKRFKNTPVVGFRKTGVPSTLLIDWAEG